jgi:hypothetical protein
MKKIISILWMYSILIAANAQPPSDTSRAKLHAMLDSVQTADFYQYDSKDNLNQSMDCAKIISNPDGGFMAVYHHYINSQPQVFLATSSDFITWNVEVTLALNASQPTIAVSTDGGYVLAWEQEPNNHLKVVYYDSLTNLFNNITSSSFDIPRSLSTCAEGTPNIYSASSTQVDIGFHYFHNCVSDRQAQGTLSNFSTWVASALSNFDNSLLYWGVAGNIGDRDAFVYDNYDFGLIEGQFINGDFGSWRTFIYDYQTGNAEQLHIVTHNGSTAFANPTLSIIPVNGKQAIVTTLFLPSEGAVNGEAGELIYYRFLDGGINLSANSLEGAKAVYKIFPNPTNQSITVESNLNEHDLNYAITDISGSQKLAGKLNNKTTSINISQLATGIYYFQLDNHPTKLFSVIGNKF